MPYVAPPTKIAGDVLTSALWNSYVRDNFDAGVMRPIGDSGFLGSAQATIDFTSIVATFAHLLLVLYARGDTAAVTTNLNIRFNNDSGGNYDVQSLFGQGATPSAAESFGGTAGGGGVIPANTAGANLFSHHDIFIPAYAGAANNKIARSVWSSKSGVTTGQLATGINETTWRSNAAINRITLLPAAGNFQIGSRAMLYGIPA